MGTHPIFESDFDCLTEMNRLATPVRRLSSQVPKRVTTMTTRTMLARPPMGGSVRRLGLIPIMFPIMFISADVFSMLLTGELLTLWAQQYVQGVMSVTLLAFAIMEASIAVNCIFHP